MNRRNFSQALIGSVASYALLRTLFLKEAFGSTVKPNTEQWLRGVHEICRDLKTSTITPAQWQKKINELYDLVSLEDLLATVDFDKLIQGFEYADLGVKTKEVPFPRLEGLPEKQPFISRLFGMQKDRAIIPHGHKNMVSCHYVLKGEFWLRQYNRIADDDTHMIIAPTIEETAKVGSHSSISDESNNVHWLVAAAGPAFTFDVIVGDLDGKRTEINNIDPDTAEKLTGNQLRVRKLPVEEALKKYGHDGRHMTQGI